MKMIYTYGVFDMLHIGHIELLRQAKKLDPDAKLVVGVFTDKVAESFKRKPIIPEHERRQMIEELRLVDVAIYQDEFDPQKNIDFLGPNIVCKAEGAGWDKDNVPEYEGIESILLKYTDGVSTSEIIRRCHDRYIESLNG